jgi:hypothetical protein
MQDTSRSGLTGPDAHAGAHARTGGAATGVSDVSGHDVADMPSDRPVLGGGATPSGSLSLSRRSETPQPHGRRPAEHDLVAALSGPRRPGSIRRRPLATEDLPDYVPEPAPEPMVTAHSMPKATRTTIQASMPTTTLPRAEQPAAEKLSPTEVDKKAAGSAAVPDAFRGIMSQGMQAASDAFSSFTSLLKGTGGGNGNAAPSTPATTASDAAAAAAAPSSPSAPAHEVGSTIASETEAHASAAAASSGDDVQV